MTPELIRVLVKAIASMDGDDEKQHASEDQLWRDVLDAIADGTAEDPRQCAAEALKTEDLDFSRWYA